MLRLVRSLSNLEPGLPGINFDHRPILGVSDSQRHCVKPTNCLKRNKVKLILNNRLLSAIFAVFEHKQLILTSFLEILRAEIEVYV